jgi:hypothetical protein
MPKELRTVLDAGGTPLLEIVKDDNAVVIYEADDMDRQIQFPVSAIPAVASYLQSL